MRNAIEKFLSKHRLITRPETIGVFVTVIQEFIYTKEFEEHYAQRISPVDFGLGDNVNLTWRKTMSALTEAMAAVAAAIKQGQQSGVDPAHIASLDQAVDKLNKGENVNASDITDIKNALSVLKDGLVPSSAPANENPAPAPAPVPAPEPEPSPEPSPAPAEGQA